MTLDLSKIKSDAEKIAANSDLLLMALPVKDVLGMLSELEKFDDGMRSLAFQLSAGGYNAKTLTADQLVSKVSDGLKSFVESTGTLIDGLRKDASRYRWLRQDTVKSLPIDGALDSLDKKIDTAIAKEKKHG